MQMCVTIRMTHSLRTTHTGQGRMLERLRAALADRYRVDRELGAGGMATVYLAHDIRHDRDVAIKVLHPDLGAALGADRFLSEIKTTARLQHPHILPLLDSGSADGLLYYVMPLVTGETLRARLERETQLPVDDALRIARDVAEALAEAHARGVIHRDIKPENILLQAGRAVVADFGIALAVQQAGGQRMTQTGLSLGTPHYMAPEQAMGEKTIDARADIYALGAITYEMLVGEPPHTGNTVQAVIAKVITENPRSIRAARGTVPESVEAAVMTALAKLPADRFSSAADFAAALSGKISVRMPGGVSSSTAIRRVSTGSVAWRRRAREIVAWAAAVAAAGTAVWLGTRTPALPSLGRFEVVLPDSLALSDLSTGSRVAISRDGALLAFSSQSGHSPRGLFLRSADNSVSQTLTAAVGVSFPTFSPDGRWVLYSTGLGRLMKIPVAGGTPVTLSNAGKPGQPIGSSSWGDTDRIVFTLGAELWIADDDGAKPRLLAAPDTASGVRSIDQPEILPGGTHSLAVLQRGKALNADSAELAVVSLSDGTVTLLGVHGFAPHFAAPGHIVFTRSAGVAYAVAFLPRRQAVTGPAVRILDGVNLNGSIASELAVAANGWLLYVTQVDPPSTRLIAVDRRRVERVLPFEPGRYAEPAISPDGRRIAVRVSGGAFNSGNIWIHDLQNGALSRLTSDTVSYRGTWSRDGSRILYVNRTSLETRIASRPWDGSGAETILLERPYLAEIQPGPTGGLSAIRTLDGRDIYLARTDSIAAITPFVIGPADETNPRISPDGKLLLYQSNETGRAEVYLRPIPGPGARVPVSVGGGSGARWSPDGRVIYYRSATHLMAAALSTRGQVDVVRREQLFADIYSNEGGGQTFDVFPNGREFLFLKGVSAAPPKLSVLVNWQRLLNAAGGKGVVP